MPPYLPGSDSINEWIGKTERCHRRYRRNRGQFKIKPDHNRRFSNHRSECARRGSVSRCQTRSGSEDLPKLGSSSVPQLTIPVQIQGELRNPSIRVDGKQLQEALAQASVSQAKERLVQKAKEELNRKLDGKLGEGIDRALGGQGKKLLDGFLGGSKKK